PYQLAPLSFPTRRSSDLRQLASDPAALSRSLQNQSLVYFSGITLAILDEESRTTLLDAIAKARAHGSVVAFDPNYRPLLWNDREIGRAHVTRALALCDIALPTFPDEQALFEIG